MRHRALLPTLAALGILPLCATPSGSAPSRGAAISDFTFIHLSDVHVPPGVQRKTGREGGPQFGSAEVIAQIKTLTAPIELTPYKVTVPPPTFAIATGDLTEFGGLSGWWDDYLALWKGSPFPAFHQSGNHDATWACQRFQIRKLYGQAYYSFDRNGCHFIAMDSATPQDPRPSFGEEEFRWLQEDLKRVSKTTPIFVYCHHPLEGKEFASELDKDRLLDLLRPYNLALLLVGHGHSAVYRKVDGVDQVMGGSTFGNAPGYSVVSVKDGMLRVAYRRSDEATPGKPLLERPLPTRSTYPVIEVRSPKDSATLSSGPVRLDARIDRTDITGARWEADGLEARRGSLTLSRGGWTGTVDTSGWEPGAHALRVYFQAPDRTEFRRTLRVNVSRNSAEGLAAVWKAQLGGAGKATPAVTEEWVVTGGQDGVLYAFDRRSGKQKWSFKTGGEILAKPLLHQGRWYVGSGDGKFYCLDLRGKQVWSFDAAYPLYSGAAVAGDTVLVAANNGRLYGLDAGTGLKRWENKDPEYSFESRPALAVDADTVYWGCWDSYVYAVNVKDGTTRWKTRGAGSAASLPGVVRYYSPADAAPILVEAPTGREVWVADRNFRLSVMDAATGKMLREEPDISSVALSEDGRSVYLRGSKGELRKVDRTGKTLWKAAAETSVVPTQALELEGTAYSVTGNGRVFALDAATGALKGKFHATPGAYVFADPVGLKGTVYVAGMDGSLTALRLGGKP